MTADLALALAGTNDDSSPAAWHAGHLRDKLAALNDKARRFKWDSATDLDWTAPNIFGAPLPADSAFALACFDRSPIRRYGPEIWDAFRWEFQSWMISQFLAGEKAALTTASGLAGLVPSPEARACLVVQAQDEARHVDVFSRYVRDRIPQPYTVSDSFDGLLSAALDGNNWDFAILGLQVIVEALALAAFRMADSTFHDPLMQRICRLAAQDEARHVSLGVIYLQSLYAQLTAAERREREEFAVEAIDFVYRRFRLEPIWDRLGIRRDDGIEFAETSPLMIAYRRTVCTTIVSSLRNLGLIGPQMAKRLKKLQLGDFKAAPPVPVRNDTGLPS